VTDEVARVVFDVRSADGATVAALSTHVHAPNGEAARPGGIAAPTHLHAAARFDATAALAMRSHVADSTRAGAPIVMIDVSGVRTITPSAVAVVLDLLRLARAGGGDLRIFGDSRTFTLAYETMALARVTRLHGDSAEAASPSHVSSSPHSGQKRGRGAHRRPAVSALG
jgi:cellulose synthase (UDP-forming)